MAKNAPEKDKYEVFIESWESRTSKPFHLWVLDLTDAFNDMNIGLKLAAKLIETRAEELQAALNLSILDEKQLIQIGKLNPPKTTWYRLAESDEGEFEVVLKTLTNISLGVSPSIAIEEAIRAFRGPTPIEKVSALSSDAFARALKKDDSFKILTEKDRNLLKSLKSKVSTGSTMSMAQASYAVDVLKKLAAGGAIQRKSSDGDEVICDQILDALDLP
jgi:hypothetical protein